MKTKLFLFLMGFLMIGLVSAIINPLVYDDFQDGYFNTTLWYNHTFGDGVGAGGMTAEMREEIGNLYLRVAQVGGGGAGPNDFMNVSVNTTKFMSVNDLMLFVRNVTTKVTKGADGSKVFGYVNMFGEKVNPTGADSSIFVVHYNDSSKGLYYTNDNAFQSVFNATNNEVKYTVELKEGSSTTDIDMYVYDLNYTLRRTVAVNLTSPINNSNFLNSTLHFISNLSTPSIEEDAYSLANATLHIWDSENNIISTTTNVVSGSSNLSEYDINPLPTGYYTWNVLACTIDGNSQTNCDYSESNRSFFYGLIINSETYNASIIETSIETFKINISTGVSHWSSVTGILNYNGTNYTGIQTGEIGPSNSIEFLATLDIAQLPTGVTSSQRPFNWIFTFVNSTATESFQNPSQNQTVSQLQFELCNSTGIPFVNFTIYNASTPYNKLNATFKSTWRIRPSVDSAIYLNRTYEDLTEGNGSFKFCFYPQDKSYIVDADIEIDGINSAKNFHYFVDNTLTNDTSEVSLYLIDNAQATLTTLQVNDQSQRGISDVLISIQLYDVGTDTFYNVGMAKTSDGGNDLAYLNWYESLYKFVLVKDGSTLLSTSPYKISETPQTFTIIPGLTDTFSKFRDFSYSLIFNNDTKNFVLTYVKPSGSVDSACLLVNKINSTGSHNICSTCETSSSATLYCNIANSGNGTFTASFYATGSFWYGETITIFQGIRSLIYEKIGLNNGAWFAFIFSGIVFSAFLISPTLGIVGLIAGVIGSSTLGFETYSGLQYYVFIVLGGIVVIWLLKR